jgi:hypothetical protein
VCVPAIKAGNKFLVILSPDLVSAIISSVCSRHLLIGNTLLYFLRSYLAVLDIYPFCVFDSAQVSFSVRRKIVIKTVTPQFEFHFISFSFMYKTTVRAIIILHGSQGDSETISDMWYGDCKLNDLWMS